MNRATFRADPEHPCCVGSVAYGPHPARPPRAYTVVTPLGTGRPIAVNLPTDDGSRTVFVAPRDWTEERLRGWVAGRHEELGAAFGPATPVRMEDL